MSTHSLYDILERLVERVTWSSEAEKVQMLASVEEARKSAALGARVTEMECAHVAEVIERRIPGPSMTFSIQRIDRCSKCGREKIL